MKRRQQKDHGNGKNTMIVHYHSEGNVIVTVVGDDMSYVKVLRVEDAKFIANARDDIPKLLETIDKLETYRDSYEAYFDGYKQGRYDLQMDNLNGK
ncbi:hypothetical protein ABE137_07090 [Brevibacillus laterosporus]|uniref:hypothetical protein n=1 Tax=Brevibacillus laterosporus TaxID=1465 RepID=UPI003D250D8B